MKFVRILLFFVVILLTGCKGVTGQVSYQPPVIPLTVTIDTNGKINFELDTKVEYPTPLGTFSVGVVVDPVEYFSVKNTLTIRVDGQEDNIYDLHGKDFEISFEFRLLQADF